MVNREYPFVGHYFDRGDGIRMHYLDEGQGPPVVMVHGNPTWSFYYRHLIQELRRDHRCIVPDHVGCGLSDKPQTGYAYELADRTADFDKLIDSLKLAEPLTLVVHDWGGMIGMNHAVRHAKSIARLVILNTGGFPLPKAKPLPRVLKLGRNTRAGEYLIRQLNLFCRRTAAFGVKRRPLSAEARKGYLEPYDSWESRIAVARFVQTIPLSDEDAGWAIVKQTEAGLSQFRDTPTLIGWGEQDFIFDTHFLAEWKSHLPKATVMSWPEYGHYILEDAADELIPAIGRFVRGS